MKAVIIREISEFKKLEKDWNFILSNSSIENVFLTFEWQFSWWQHFKHRYLLYIILVLDKNQIVGIAPLMLSKQYGFRQLRFISGPNADYEDIITTGDVKKREEIIAIIIETLGTSKDWDMFRLEGIRGSSPNFILFSNISRKKNNLKVSFQAHKDGAPYIPITESWEEYCFKLRKKFLSDTKRQLSKLTKEDNLLFSENIVDKSKIPPLLNTLMEFHKARHKSLGHRSIFEDKVICNFFGEVADVLFDKGWLDLRFIQINNAIIALHLGFRYRDIFYYYFPTFSNEFRQYSVGRLLLFDLIFKCFSNNIKQFDFMAGREDYKNEWNPRIEPLYFLSIYHKTVLGYMAYLNFDKIIIGLKALLGKKW